MTGIVLVVDGDMVQVESDGVIYNTTPTMGLKFTKKIRVGDHVLLDSQTLRIIEIM